MIHQSGLDEYFEFLVSNEDVIAAEARSRRSTSTAHRADGRRRRPDTLIVEDAPHGVEAARRRARTSARCAGFADVDYFRVRAAIDRAERARPRADGTAVAA